MGLENLKNQYLFQDNPHLLVEPKQVIHKAGTLGSQSGSAVAVYALDVVTTETFAVDDAILIEELLIVLNGTVIQTAVTDQAQLIWGSVAAAPKGEANTSGDWQSISQVTSTLNYIASQGLGGSSGTGTPIQFVSQSEPLYLPWTDFLKDGAITVTGYTAPDQIAFQFLFGLLLGAAATYDFNYDLYLKYRHVRGVGREG